MGKSIYRSSRPEVFCKTETLAQVFPVNFEKVLRAPFLEKTSGDCFCIYIPRFLQLPDVQKQCYISHVVTTE